MLYIILVLLLSFSCQAHQEDGDNEKIDITTYSCIGSNQGHIFSVKATSTEYIILNKRCLANGNNLKATSTEYIILLVD